MVLSTLYSVYILLDSASLNFLDLLNNIKVDAVWIVYITVRVRKCNYLAAQLSSLLCSVDSNVTRTRDNNCLACECFILHALDHLRCVVAKTITSSLCSCK